MVKKIKSYLNSNIDKKKCKQNFLMEWGIGGVSFTHPFLQEVQTEVLHTYC